MVVLVLFSVDCLVAARPRALPAPDDGLRILSSKVSSTALRFMVMLISQ
jgi:hypothetical protein